MKCCEDTGQERLSRGAYEIEKQTDRRVAMGDGVRLLADIYLPEGCGGVVPALVCFSPFGKEVQGMALERQSLRTGQSMFDQTIEACDIGYFVRHGYAVVAASPRGIGNSEGVHRGLLSEADQRDCCELIAWTAAQPWCSGKIGMMGAGFAGRIQPLVAARAPKALCAIMPIDLTDDCYKENYPGGLVSDYAFAYGGLIPANSFETEAMSELGEDGLKARLAQLRADPQMAASSYTWRALDSWPPCFNTWCVDNFVHAADCDFWQVRSFAGKTADIHIPVYAVSYYYEFGRSTASAVKLFQDEALAVPKKLLLVGPGYDKRSPCDEINEEMLRWYDHWLLGCENGIMDEPPVLWGTIGESGFSAGERWPPKGVQHNELFLSGGSLLCESAGEGAPDALLHRPPTRVSQNAQDIPFLEYQTEPFPRDTVITGAARLSLFASIDREYGNIIALLWDVAPDGQRVTLGGAAQRAEGSGREIRRYDIKFTPVSCKILAGHRLRLHVKAMDYPLYSPMEKRTFPLLFPSGRAIGPIPSTEFTKYSIYHDGQYPSCLKIPIAPASDKGKERSRSI